MIKVKIFFPLSKFKERGFLRTVNVNHFFLSSQSQIYRFPKTWFLFCLFEKVKRKSKWPSILENMQKSNQVLRIAVRLKQ